jgi:hypothetical protein
MLQSCLRWVYLSLRLNAACARSAFIAVVVLSVSVVFVRRANDIMSNVYDLEIDCDTELLPSILVQNLLNLILTLADDLREMPPTECASTHRTIHHFRPRIVADAEIFEQLLLYYEWCNGQGANSETPPPPLLLRMTIKISPTG